MLLPGKQLRHPAAETVPSSRACSALRGADSLGGRRSSRRVSVGGGGGGRRRRGRGSVGSGCDGLCARYPPRPPPRTAPPYPPSVPRGVRYWHRLCNWADWGGELR
eukprot:281877-Rhodomonas_salina.6